MPEAFEKRLEHPCFPHPEDRSSLVWRYVPLSKFISLLQSSQLHLSRIDLLNDPHEGSLPTPLVVARNNFLQEKGLTHVLPHAEFLNQKVRQSCYVNCWALSPFESEALWRLYATDTDGIAIQTTYQELISAIEPDSSLYVGRVNYLDYETEWFPDGNLFYSVMHKRRAFAHENEVRLVKMLHDHMGMDDPSGPPSVSVPINFDAFVQAIYVTPYAQTWYAEVVKAVVEKFAPALVSKIYWSRMKSAPLY